MLQIYWDDLTPGEYIVTTTITATGNTEGSPTVTNTHTYTLYVQGLCEYYEADRHCGNNTVDCDEACDFEGIVNNKICVNECSEECDFGVVANRYLVQNDTRTTIADDGRVEVYVGDQVHFEIEVRSPGCISYSNVQVTSTSGIIYTLISGDTNTNNILDIGETWLFRSAATTLASGEQVVTSTVIATADYPGNPTVTDEHTFTLVVLEKECIWIVETAGWSLYREAGNNIWDREIASRDRVDEYQAVPSCFAEYFSSRCRMHWNTGVKTEAWIQDYMNQADANIVREIPADVNTEGVTIFGVCQERMQQLSSFLGAPTDANISWTTASSASYYMDENCRYVPASDLPSKQVCGYAGLAWTPISLILDEDSYSESTFKIVDFSLTLDGQDQLSVWKASAAAPLLVFDPDRTGEVLSAKQLFGNWTFGGKQKSLLRQASLGNGSYNEPWSNGYEALAQLDLNQDGEISGAELEVMSLWFDANQNAKVDEGEIKTLKEAGITALYYKGAETNSGRELELKIGYERVVDGKVVSGRSLDWQGETFSSVMDALNGLKAMLGMTEDLLAPSRAANISPLDFTVPKVSEADYPKDISGFWIWAIEGDVSGLQPGVLALKQDSAGKVTGYTVVEANLATNEANLKSTVQIVPVEGEVTRTNEGLLLEFNIDDPNTGLKARSKALLKAEGQILDGETVQSFSKLVDGRTETVEASYRWAAGR